MELFNLQQQNQEAHEVRFICSRGIDHDESQSFPLFHSCIQGRINMWLLKAVFML